MLLYFIIYPVNFDGSVPTNAAFSKTDLKRGSLSVCRSRYSTPEEVIKQVMRERPDRRLDGALRALCQDVRRIEIDPMKARAFCVIDDGLPDYKAHAHIGFSEETKEEGFWARALNGKTTARANLIRTFGNPLSLQTAFETAV